MRTVIDARYLHGRPSGIGAYVRALVDRLPALAPDDAFEVWAPPAARTLLPRAPNLTHREVKVPPNSLSTVFWPSRLGPLEHADLFHSPHNVLGRGLQCPAVATVHDLMFVTSPHLESLGTRLKKQLFLPGGTVHAIRAAARILAPSNATADEILGFAPFVRDRIRVTPLAADPVFAPAADVVAARRRATVLLGGEEPFFLCIGLNQPSKGHRFAVEAFAVFGAPDERLVFVQRDRPGGRLRMLAARRGVLDRCRWMGSLQQADVVALLQTATALLQPSLMEGFGLPVLEAMSCGCPVISSDIPPLREVLGGAGLPFSAGDAVELGRRMRRVADQPTLGEELKARGLERARDFSWDRCAEATLEAYREAAAAGPALA